MLGIYGALLGIFWRQRSVRYLLIFLGIWWLIFLGPILLLTKEWVPRWLTLSSWAIGGIVAVLLQQLFTRQRTIATNFLYLAITVALMYGLLVPRMTNIPAPLIAESAAMHALLEQLREQERPAAAPTTIHIVGKLPDRLRIYFFALHAKKPYDDILVHEQIPTVRTVHDIVIDTSTLPQ